LAGTLFTHVTVVQKLQILTQKALLRQTFSNKFAAMTEIASGTSLPEIPAGKASVKHQ
jgi:hypothetical protein